MDFNQMLYEINDKWLKICEVCQIVHAKYNTFTVYYDTDSMAKHSSCKLIYN